MKMGRLRCNRMFTEIESTVSPGVMTKFYRPLERKRRNIRNYSKRKDINWWPISTKNGKTSRRHCKASIQYVVLINESTKDIIIGELACPMEEYQYNNITMHSLTTRMSLQFGCNNTQNRWFFRFPCLWTNEDVWKTLKTPKEWSIAYKCFNTILLIIFHS